MAFISTSMAASNKSDYVFAYIRKVNKNGKRIWESLYLHKDCKPKEAIDVIRVYSNTTTTINSSIFCIGKRRNGKKIEEGKLSERRIPILAKKFGLSQEELPSSLCELTYDDDDSSIAELLTPESIRLCTKKEVNKAWNSTYKSFLKPDPKSGKLEDIRDEILEEPYEKEENDSSFKKDNSHKLDDSSFLERHKESIKNFCIVVIVLLIVGGIYKLLRRKKINLNVQSKPK